MHTWAATDCPLPMRLPGLEAGARVEGLFPKLEKNTDTEVSR